MQGIADKTRVAWRSGQSRNLPIGGDLPFGMRRTTS